MFAPNEQDFAADRYVRLHIRVELSRCRGRHLESASVVRGHSHARKQSRIDIDLSFPPDMNAPGGGGEGEFGGRAAQGPGNPDAKPLMMAPCARSDGYRLGGRVAGPGERGVAFLSNESSPSSTVHGRAMAESPGKWRTTREKVLNKAPAHGSWVTARVARPADSQQAYRFSMNRSAPRVLRILSGDSPVPG